MEMDIELTLLHIGKAWRTYGKRVMFGIQPRHVGATWSGLGVFVIFVFRVLWLVFCSGS